MTDLLVRLFVKDYEKTENADVRTAYGVLAGIVGIICNLLLFGVKAAIGLILGSIAVIADALNNMTDAVSSIISLIGAKLANKPADKKHPFGYGRYEYISAFIVAFLVIQVGFSCAKSAVGKIAHPAELTFSMVSVIILCISILGKVWLAVFNKKLGQRIHSTVMKATAADAMGDVLTTTATVISIFIFRIFDLNIDGIVGFIVALIVIWAGIGIAKDTLKPLLGESVDPELASEIKALVEDYDGILGSHDLIVHNYGPTKSMATIHAEVPSSTDVQISHELIDRIEREVTKKTGVFLVIHMDPIEVDDGRVVKYRNEVNKIIEGVDNNISAHDFRMVSGETQINLIFDLVVPHEYSSEKNNALLFKIMEAVKAFDSRCECVITVENSYTGE